LSIKKKKLLFFVVVVGVLSKKKAIKFIISSWFKLNQRFSIFFNYLLIISTAKTIHNAIINSLATAAAAILVNLILKFSRIF